VDPDFKKFYAQRTKLMRVSEIRTILRVIEEKGVISFAGGLPDPNLFPKKELSEIASYVIREYGSAALQYSVTRGVTLFRKSLSYFMSTKGINVPPDNILVTTGSQQALDLIARALIDPGDIIAVELPTYLAALNAFRLSEPEFIGIPIDDDGMRVDILEEKLRELSSKGKKVKMVYTVPTAQNPSGVTMSQDRRKHLLELAEQYDFLIIEDDPYSHFLFEPIEFKHLKAMDETGRVIYLSTFSKILAPGLRIGWVAAHEDIIAILERAKQNLDLHTPTLSQYIAMEAIKRGVVERYIPIMRETYKRKRNVMLDALEDHFPSGCRWTKPVGGMFIFAYLPESIDTKEMLLKAIDAGVAYVPGRAFFVDGSGWNTMRLNFSFPSEDKIIEGVKILGRVIREELKSKGS